MPHQIAVLVFLLLIHLLEDILNTLITPQQINTQKPERRNITTCLIGKEWWGSVGNAIFSLVFGEKRWQF